MLSDDERSPGEDILKDKTTDIIQQKIM